MNPSVLVSYEDLLCLYFQFTKQIEKLYTFFDQTWKKEMCERSVTLQTLKSINYKEEKIEYSILTCIFYFPVYCLGIIQVPLKS